MQSTVREVSTPRGCRHTLEAEASPTPPGSYDGWLRKNGFFINWEPCAPYSLTVCNKVHAGLRFRGDINLGVDGQAPLWVVVYQRSSPTNPVALFLLLTLAVDADLQGLERAAFLATQCKALRYYVILLTVRAASAK
jgi:hypothetical protein